MSDRVIFHEKEHGKYSESMQPFILYDAEIKLTSFQLIINSKLREEPVIYTLLDLKNAQLDGFIIIVTLKKDDTQFAITFRDLERYKNKLIFELSAALKTEILAAKSRDKYNRITIEIIDFISRYDEITYQEISEHFDAGIGFIVSVLRKFITEGSIRGKLLPNKIVLRESKDADLRIIAIEIPPGTKFSELKCPNCDAKVLYMPPCECESCGIMIDVKRRVRARDIMK